MAFLLYQTTALEDGNMQYDRIKEVRLAGNRNGLIYSACKRYLSDKNVGWTITDRDMLTAGDYDPANHALVIDTEPNSRVNVGLFEIKSIAGYSYEGWTPLMLTFQMLFSDRLGNIRKIRQIKRQFHDGESDRRIVREFLYVGGGYSQGKWNWGGNSRTTAALLWTEAWDYFHQRP